MARKPYGALYIGVTKSLLGRIEAHRDGTGSRFTARYGVKMLVHFEPFADIKAAIQGEKTLKPWVQQWKINLIERDNPHCSDLYPELFDMSGNRIARASGVVGPRDKPEDDT